MDAACWFKLISFSALAIALLVESHVFVFWVKDEIKRREWRHAIFAALMTIGLTYGVVDLSCEVQDLVSSSFSESRGVQCRTGI